MIVFIRTLDDCRRPGRPGDSKREEQIACGIWCFFGTAKKTSGYHFNDFGGHFEAHFCIVFCKKTCFFPGVVFLQFCDIFGEVPAAGGRPILLEDSADFIPISSRREPVKGAANFTGFASAADLKTVIRFLESWMNSGMNMN